MGGITLVSPELRTASPENQNGQVLFDIPEIDIRQSKGDDVLFAILQTSELELVTLALASVHVATFAIWWHKPLGVQEPVRIYWRRERDSESRHVESAARHGHSSRTLSFQSAEQGQTSSFQPAAEQGHPSWSFGVSFGDVTRGIWRFVNNFAFFMLKNPLYLIIGIPIAFTYIISFPFFLLFPLGIISLLKILETQLFHGLLALIVPSFQTLRYGLGLAFMDLGGWLEVIFRGENFLPTLFGWYFLLPPLFLLLFLFTLFLTPLVLIFFILTSVKTSIHHAFKEGDRWSRMVFALSGVIIGGLHCIAWNFDYPTNSVQLVWQISSFFITVIPAIALVEPFTPRVSTTVLFSYILVRLFLIVQAIALLRKQPSSAFAAVDWTKYVPHLFPQ